MWIKQLILAVALSLLVSGLAHATGPSATLSVQIVPAPAGGSLACDQGPNATSVPAPAQAAGFTKCLLNADFTSAAYSNPANWLTECGYGGSASNTTFRLIFNDPIHSQVRGAPCNRAVMTTDLGSQVLLLELYQNDYAVNGFDVLELDWPTDAYTSRMGPNGVGLQHAQYAEVTFRMPESSAQESGGRQFLPYAFWFNLSPGVNNETEVDWFEIYSNDCGINPGAGAPGGSCVFSSNVNLGGVNTLSPVLPIGNAYHTFGFLQTTSDGITFGACIYYDGATVACSGPGTLNSSNGVVDVRAGLLENWLNNDCGASPGCNPNTIQVYIKSEKLWGCPNYWNGICTGNVITSAIESDTKFAARREWLWREVMAATVWLDHVLPSAYAQVL